MRRCGALAAIACMLGSVSPVASAQSAADQRWHINAILAEKDPDAIRTERAQCALGRAPTLIAKWRGLGASMLLDAAPWCIAVLTRAGRNGTLSYVRDPSNPSLTPALSFDNGFVAGYSKKANIPADAPSMAALQPVAERCLGQREADTELCNAAGYAIGARAARGELPVIS